MWPADEECDHDRRSGKKKKKNEEVATFCLGRVRDEELIIIQGCESGRRGEESRVWGSPPPSSVALTFDLC